MNQTIDNLLKDLRACKNAREWAFGKTFKEILDTCHRGDWLLWLYARTNPDDKRLITLVKGYCAQTAIHLMKDERSRKAVEVAIKYGQGEATDEELAGVLDGAVAAANDAVTAATLAAAYAADAATYAADAAARAAAYTAAKKQNQLQTADICRKYFTNWNI